MLNFILILLLILSVLFWIVYLLRTMSNYRKLPDLSKITYKKSEKLPMISAIIPARNEEKKISPFIETLKKQTYPNLEILIMDDYSTDKTVEKAKTAIGEDERFKIINLKSFKDEKPDGWAGKSYALQRGTTIAKGEWFLFSDVDYIDHNPDLIERAVQHAIANKLDLLSLVPRNSCKSFWEKIIQPIPAGLLIFLSPFAKVNDPKNRASFALGLFILIKREIFNKIGGYEKIRGHIADDVEMAKLVKESGFKIGLANAQNIMRFRMYENLGEIWQGWSKNIFLGLIQKRRIQSKTLQVLTLLAGLFAVFEAMVLPFIALIISTIALITIHSQQWQNLFVFSAITWLLATITQSYVHKKYGIGDPKYSPLYFLGGIITMGIFLNSAYKTLTGTGLTWKQRTYTDKTT